MQKITKNFHRRQDFLIPSFAKFLINFKSKNKEHKHELNLFNSAGNIPRLKKLKQ